jgi:hypothetical protein
MQSLPRSASATSGRKNSNLKGRGLSAAARLREVMTQRTLGNNIVVTPAFAGHNIVITLHW